MPSPPAATIPSSVSAMLAVPNSRSHSTKTTIAVKMPPIKDGIDRLTLTSIGAAAIASRLGRREPRIGRRGARLLQVRLAEARVIAVEEMPQRAAIEIAGAEQPVGERIGQVEVGAHHDRLVVIDR